MGIFIRLAISCAISQEEWEPAYEESLRLAKAFGLCDNTGKKKYDRDLYCLIPTEETTIRGKKAWCAVGDLNILDEKASIEKIGLDGGPHCGTVMDV